MSAICSIHPAPAIIKRLGLGLLGALLLVASPSALLAAEAEDAPGAEVKGVFVVVSSPDPQTQMMAMVLSNQVLNQGKTVQVLLCGPGGDLALAEGEEVRFKPRDLSPQMLLKRLMEHQVTVEVCAIYLPNSDHTEADLVEGVGVAKPPAIATALLEPGVKLFTF
ncbi:MAG: hypothetical protein ACFCBW_22230 [Candidatus Competibacterales bacterium]